MFQSIFIPFLTICLAELGDKSQLSILLLSSKFKNHTQLLAGILLAFLIVDGSAIFFGAWITSIFPINFLSVIAGIAFILFGVAALNSKPEKDETKIDHKNAFISGFTLILISEWGDKTQIASALFATNYNPFLVLLGTMAAMSVLSITAIYLGNVLLKRINKNLLSKISGILFITIGLTSLLFHI